MGKNDPNAPAFVAPATPAAAPSAAERRTPREHAAAKGTPLWLFNAAAVGLRWTLPPAGPEERMTESEYDAAIQGVATAVSR